MQPEEKWHLPARFRLDSPEKLAAAAQAQKELAQRMMCKCPEPQGGGQSAYFRCEKCGKLAQRWPE